MDRIIAGAFLAVLAAARRSSAFQVAPHTGTTAPAPIFPPGTPHKIKRTHPMTRDEIFKRVGGNTNDGPNGHGKNNYVLRNEHEVVYPITGTHQGILAGTACSFASPFALLDDVRADAETIASHPDLVSRAIQAGSIAASVRNRGAESDTAYYVPSAVTLVESLIPDEVASLWKTDDDDDESSLEEVFSDDDAVLYACNTHCDKLTANSDVYVFLPPSSPTEKRSSLWSKTSSRVWKFSIEYKIATINLRQIVSFPTHIPDVWLKDDCY